MSGVTVSAQQPDTYVSIVQQYAAGDGAGAAKRIGPSNARLPGDAVDRIRRLPARDVRSAVMLHTELAAVALASGSIGGASTQISNAQRLLDILTADTRTKAASRTFAVRWFAFATHLFTAQGLSDHAYRMVRDGLTVFPDAADLYVARGSVHEMRARAEDAALRARRLTGADGTRRFRRLLEVAVEDFDRAAKADPALATAYLHRGDVRRALGDHRAAEDLGAALAAATDDRVRYLAHLFLGSIAEEKDDLQTAGREFAAARSAAPCQSAFVALGRIEAQLGHFARSQELSAEYAQQQPKLEDPWWDFLLGGFPPGALEWLLQEARRP